MADGYAPVMHSGNNDCEGSLSSGTAVQLLESQNPSELKEVKNLLQDTKTGPAALSSSSSAVL